jgi:hypothetical protein
VAFAALANPVSPTFRLMTLTFLLTDIEGSTRLWETHRQAMEEALACHDRLVSQVVADHGGQPVRSAARHRPRVPVALGRLHPTRVTSKLASQTPSCTSPAVVVVNRRVSTWRPPWPSGTRTLAVTESLCTSRPAQRSTSVSRCLPPPPRQRSLPSRGNLYPGNLSLVLVATVRGARGSHVRLISGLAAPREHRHRPDDPHSFIRRGWPTTAMGGLSAIPA